MKNEHVILKSASSRVTLSVAKGLAFLFVLMLSLTACSDYEADYEDMYGYLVEAGTDVALSSSLSSSWSREEAIGSSSSSIKYGSEYDAVANTLKDLRDNQTYKTVTIGSQTWMAENLNYDPGNVSSMGSYAWSGCYGNESSNCTKYGRLYTWEVAMDDAGCAYGKACNASLNPSTPVRGVCPSGWHLPSHREFEELINFVDPSFGYNHTGDAGSSTAGKYLKSQSGWNSSGNGTDAYGFSALPGGYRDYDGDFYDEGNFASFWSSGEYSSLGAFLLSLYYDSGDAYLDWDYEGYARSVRCLKDSN
ncbi:fibrobacter succinogenes major paralogous domain-containing protein [Fibrobacter sp. UWR1]|uniref:fibrobacter succinogenes major paralogous domain-containing protein n=1 Tax=Fibrobacter sp. UWR1 TaxID=2135645 RepID=UPI000DB1C242|nr:fibrobacter succinogenes major paralogous domain-containing protein [Fibrobacter sp. UWR1]PZW72918.1 uncharacterized protein (TIGR02145 family) [Fibrobacter sp. UWR1]